MKRYSVEVFNKDFALIDHGPVNSDSVDIRDDYISLDASEFTVPKRIVVERRNYVILKLNGSVEYQGIVSDYEYEHENTIITCKPLISLMDVQVYLKRSTLRSTALEQILADKLTAVYSNSDTLQSLTGFTTTVSGSTINTSLGGDDDLVNLYDAALDALRKYNILCKWSIDVSAQTITCAVQHLSTATPIVIDLTVPDVIESTIQIQSISNSYNKIKYYNDNNRNQSITYYIHSDGTVDDVDSDRLTPVIYCERLAEESTLDGVTMTWQEVALGNAKSTMVNSSLDNEITVTVKADSKVIRIGEIGTTYRLIDQTGIVYTSILTGYEKDSTEAVTLLFGMIRTKLTSILRMESRK